ncbi:MAG: hypothetical protein AB8I08_17085 [Sandaracinaceae bacterium]
MSAEVLMGVRLFVLCLSLVLMAGCGDDRPRSGRGGSDAGVMGDGGAARCGNGIREGEETCDGLDLGGQSCLGLGLGGGALSCTASCTLATSGCDVSCTPNCEARQCGFDPACPTASCGECGSGTCSAAGTCEGAGPGAPQVLSLTSDAASLVGPGDLFNIVAVVDDPDGVATITRGQLENFTGEVVYGEFLDYGAGRYELEGSLSEFNEITPLEAPVGGGELFLRARFFDATGQEATSSLSLNVGCVEAPLCGNECPDTSSDPDHCGECGAYCEGTCLDGGCMEENILVYILEGTCETGCASDGYACNPGGALGPEEAFGPECEGTPVCVYNYETDVVTSGTCSTPISIFGTDVEALCACRSVSAE